MKTEKPTEKPTEQATEQISEDTHAAPDLVKIPSERSRFRALLLSNPNHFGNLLVSPWKPVKTIISNTTFEELKCVGFNPQLNLLEAVVWVKRPSGYGGDICSQGTPEYVRFWLSFDNGATWLDQGLESFTAYDIAVDFPLEYAVTRRITPFQRPCRSENLPLVRAVLSWNHVPTDPLVPPVWGNALDARIQIAPGRHLFFSDLVKEAKLTLPAAFAGLVDPTQAIPLVEPTTLSLAELKAVYADKGVPEHRFLHTTLSQFIANPGLAEATLVPGKGFLSELGVDWAKAVGAFLDTDGDTGFEQLQCVGLDPNSDTPDALVATLKIKRPYGYLGDLCHTGSVEYVGFWIDWGAGWEWVGTAQVKVHDIGHIPPEGLDYAVYQPVNLSEHRRDCHKGATIARVRAVLSWNSPLAPGNPNVVPHWGNRVETHVHVYPGTPVSPGDYTPFLQSICGIALCNIDQTTGFASGERPFGGSVSIFGQIPGAPPVTTAPADRPRYLISVRKLGTPNWQNVNDGFSLTVDEQIGSALPTSTNIMQAADGADFFTYEEAPPVAGVGWRTVTPARLLGVWNTTNKSGLYEIKVEATNPTNGATFVAGGVFCVADGTTRQNVVVDLDQDAPITTLHVTGYQPGGVGPIIATVDCGTFKVGDVLHGDYSVADEHFNTLTLSAEPLADEGDGHFVIDGITTRSRSYPAIPTTGQAGAWSFNTAGLAPCGYTIQLLTSDRTIVSCGGGWEKNNAFVGFCLVA